MGLFYGILAAIALSAIIMLIQGKRRKQAWRGTVTKIKQRPAGNIDDLDTKDFVDIYYKTEGGKKGKIHLYKKKFDTMYPGLQKGSRLIKQAGKDFPDMAGVYLNEVSCEMAYNRIYLRGYHRGGGRMFSLLVRLFCPGSGSNCRLDDSLADR